MKRTKRLLSLFLCLTLITGLLGLFGVAANAYDTGDFIWYGTYPQSKVTDANVINAFAKMTGLTWTSCRHYSGTGIFGSAAAGDFAQYTDFVYGTSRYRALKISTYRPQLTYSPTGAAYSNVDNNGYTIPSGAVALTTIFKWEPIKWRVLNPATGLVMCESVLDAQPFHNTPVLSGGKYYTSSSRNYYANEYIGASLRTWISNEFYAKAFTSAQKQNIAATNVSQYTNPWLDDYVSPTVSASVFPLSYGHVVNTSYGFVSSTGSSDARLAKPTDYAKCQGVSVSGSGYSPWLLASYYEACLGSVSDASKYCGSSDYITISGSVSADVVYAVKGLRLAMRLSTLKNDQNLTLPSSTPLTVTFNPTGGMTTFSTSQVYNGGYYGTLPVAYSSASTLFGGWYTADGKKVTAYTKVTATANHTLYADYEPKSIPVTLNPNGGSVSATALTVNNTGEGTVYPALPTPTYPGDATFLGWYTKDGYQVKAGSTVPNRHAHTLTAQWKINAVTVTFDAMGGTVSPKAKSYAPGKAYGSLPTPTRPGYTFNGWTRSGGSMSYVTASSTVPITNHTLYASWSSIAAVKILGYTPSRTVDYRTTITFHAEGVNAPSNVEYYWYVDGERVADKQTSYTMSEVQDDFEIYVLMRTPDNDVFVYSDTEKVAVKHGFFDRFIAFFKGLFHTLPVIDQK